MHIQPSKDVEVIQEDGVLNVTLCRPERRNALSLGVLQTIHDVFAKAAMDETLRFAILTGAGDRAFASGGDLVELNAIRSVEDARLMSEHGKRALNAVRRFPTPVVAALNGLALGGGAELALACDLRFGAAHAQIGMIHGRLNIAPSWGGGIDLMRLVGFAQGLKLLANADVLGAVEAQRVGLLDGVADAGEPFAAALERFVARFRAQTPQVMRAIKALSLGERLHGRPELEAIETDHFVEVWVHPDHWAAAERLTSGANANG